MNTGNNDICFCGTVTPVEALAPRITRCWPKNLLLVADPFQVMSPQVLHLDAALRAPPLSLRFGIALTRPVPAEVRFPRSKDWR